VSRLRVSERLLDIVIASVVDCGLTEFGRELCLLVELLTAHGDGNGVPDFVEEQVPLTVVREVAGVRVDRL